ncbi:hypothetical protein PSEWESI4_00036 [Pseudomonas carbonaria]|uniref:Uncharacterized protein n=1 Tax=Zestomonas carbonaria TaxID=2762745 RepID=A0A7U7EIP9_9GAMM|nr:hypothetical protein PSEWESI4_00036 [Pseudomonas carbonaria]
MVGYQSRHPHERGEPDCDGRLDSRVRGNDKSVIDTACVVPANAGNQ